MVRESTDGTRRIAGVAEGRTRKCECCWQARPVTSAGGFAAGSRENGWELWALSRDAQRARDSLDNVTRWFEWQPQDGPPPNAAFDGVSAVINLIGERISGIWTPAKRRTLRSSRELGTRNLVAGLAAAQDRPLVLVSASAVGYYGDRADAELTRRVSARRQLFRPDVQGMGTRSP